MLRGTSNKTVAWTVIARKVSLLSCTEGYQIAGHTIMTWFEALIKQDVQHFLGISSVLTRLAVNEICERRDTSCDTDSEKDETTVVQKINWNSVAPHLDNLMTMSWGVPGAARAVRQAHEIFWEARDGRGVL